MIHTDLLANGSEMVVEGEGGVNLCKEAVQSEGEE